MSVIVVVALVHFLWQGALVGAIAALAIKLSRSATTRYAIGVVALVVMALAPVATATWLRTLNLAATASNNLTLNLAPTLDLNPGLQVQAPKSTRDLGPGTWDRAAQALRSVQVSPVQARWLFGLWLAGVTLLSLRLTLGWRSAQRLTRVGTSQPRSEILSHADALLRALNIRKAVSVLESTLVHVPMAIGWLKPVVLLPAQSMTGLSIEQIDALIAHELAHIKRHDYLVNLLQSVLETMLFYHPAVWLISRRVRHERELCCDDLAIAVCDNDRVTYASALADMESLRQMAPPALAANGGSLLERVKRVLTNSEAQSISGGRDRLAAGLAVLAITVGLLGVQASANKGDSLLVAVTSPEGRHELAAGVRDALQTVRDLIPGESKTAVEASAAAPSSLAGLPLNNIVGGSGVLDLTRFGLTSVGTGGVVPPAQPQSLPVYRIEPGDLLTLDVMSGGVRQSDFSQRRYIVDGKGAIQVPLLDEPVTLSKMTLDEAGVAIRRALIDERKFSDAAVAVAPYVYRAGTPPAPIGPFRVGDDITIEVGAKTDADWFALYATVQPNGRVPVQNIGEVQIAGRNSEEIMVELVIAYRRQRGDAPSVSVRFDERSSRNKSHTERLESSGPVSTVVTPPVQQFPGYVIGPTDMLRVVVNIAGVNRSSVDAVVANDGSVSFSPLKEPVSVRGLTPREASAAIQRGLAAADPSVGASNAEVVVAVVQYRASKIVIRGAVRTPGLMQMTFDHLNLGDAITAAGGLMPNAGNVIRVNRAATKTWEEFRRADLTPTKLAGISLFEGDIVDVPVQAKFIVNGYVVTPGEYAWREGLTLREALDMAGGVKPQGAVNRVEIRRLNKATGFYEPVDFKKAFPGIDKFLVTIEPKDIIVVPVRRI